MCVRPKKTCHLAKGVSDKERLKTRVNVGMVFPGLQALRDDKGSQSDSFSNPYNMSSVGTGATLPRNVISMCEAKPLAVFIERSIVNVPWQEAWMAECPSKLPLWGRSPQSLGRGFVLHYEMNQIQGWTRFWHGFMLDSFMRVTKLPQFLLV